MPTKDGDQRFLADFPRCPFISSSALESDFVNRLRGLPASTNCIAWRRARASELCCPLLLTDPSRRGLDCLGHDRSFPGEQRSRDGADCIEDGA